MRSNRLTVRLAGWLESFPSKDERTRLMYAHPYLNVPHYLEVICP